MIGYSTLGSNDIETARGFYDKLLAEIGAKRLMELGPEEGGFTMYGRSMEEPALAITRPYNGEKAFAGNGNMIALQLDSHESVDKLHGLALDLGGSDEGQPGFRGELEVGFYAAYFRDPEGNKLAAFHFGPAT